MAQGFARTTDRNISGSSTPTPVRDPLTEEVTELGQPWDVLVWDDPVNLMSYVVYVLRKVFNFDEPMARKLMLEVHEQGRALVASESRDEAQRHLEQLHGHGLNATMQKST
ncbi:MAG: ATP-dependent Clp protease adaptor protein ClpS [Glaciecola sp.]